jgi:hypothetical protein
MTEIPNERNRSITFRIVVDFPTPIDPSTINKLIDCFASFSARARLRELSKIKDVDIDVVDSLAMFVGFIL